LVAEFRYAELSDQKSDGVTERDPIPPTIEWRDGAVRMIDQRRLPAELVFLEARTVDAMCDAITSLAIRGAPALGVAGAMGVALASAIGAPIDDAAARQIGRASCRERV